MIAVNVDADNHCMVIFCLIKLKGKGVNNSYSACIAGIVSQVSSIFIGVICFRTPIVASLILLEEQSEAP